MIDELCGSTAGGPSGCDMLLEDRRREDALESAKNGWKERMGGAARCLSKLGRWILLALPFAGLAQSQVVRHGDCVVDAEIVLLPRCALETRHGHWYVSRPYLPLFFSSTKDRLGATYLPNSGWAYLDRHGLVVVQHVANFDNGASPFHYGLVRVVDKEKWGLADSRGSAIVPMKYDGMYEYDEESDRGWLVCVGCHYEPRGEYGWFEGGDWYWLDRRGQVKSKAEEPPRASETSVSK